MAREQTAGRGRQGRVWAARPGEGLLVSVLVRVAGGDAGGVPLVAGVAVCDAVERLGARNGLIGLKWPNDVLVGGRAKLAGVLAEVEPAAHDPAGSPRAAGVRAPHSAAPQLETMPPSNVAVVLGVGLNLAVGEFPPGVAGANLNQLLGREVGWEEGLAALLRALGGRLRELERGGVPATVRAWREHAVGLGAEVDAHTPAGVIRGRAIDVDEDGALLVETGPGQVTRLLAGDVHLGPSR